ncbi:hypothetical protein V2P20_09460 [Methylobacter sp. Wu1]|jgi:hypothetical protein|uniref:hypothetical protein n=1 Tax=Methylobacter sp. Wu1 TaxID=3119359 RepID=UPI002F91FE99
MNYKKYGLIMFSLISIVALAAEERTEIEFNALPEAVRNTVSRIIEQKDITSIARIADDGYVKFEIKSTKTVNNKDFIETDMIVAADGEMMKMAKEAPLFDIPFPVMTQVNRRYPNLKVDEVEIVKTRYFLLTGKIDGRPVNLKINDDGEIQEIPVDQGNKAILSH